LDRPPLKILCKAPCNVSHKKTPQSGVFFRHPGKIPGEQPAITWQQMRQQQEQRQQERQMRQQQERQQQELERQEQQLLLFCRKRTKQQQR
jgi:hypothetical protein